MEWFKLFLQIEYKFAISILTYKTPQGESFGYMDNFWIINPPIRIKLKYNVKKKHQILGIIESSESWCPGSNPGSTAKLNLFE